MMRIEEPNFVNLDGTEPIRKTYLDMQPTYNVSHVWPFIFSVMTTKYGSKHWQLEFRPIMKFSITVGFFWKASNNDS